MAVARAAQLGKVISLVDASQEQDFERILNKARYPITEIFLANDQKLAKKLPLFIAKKNKKPTLKKTKDQAFSKEITKIHISTGKKEKYGLLILLERFARSRAARRGYRCY